MDLITEVQLLKDINAEFAKQIAKKWGVSEDISLIRKGFSPENFEFKEGESASIDYISTKSVDRDGDIVEPHGAIMFDYEKNPCVLWCHDYKSLPIGRCEWIRSNDHGIVAKTIYAVDANPFARQVYEYRKSGFPLGKSIGFVPIETNPKPQKGVRTHHLKYLILEYSDCPIPSNPDALNIAVSKGLIRPKDTKYFFYNLNEELTIDGEPIYDDTIDYIYRR
jgi:HK97 family phage prohead protease